MVNVTLGDVESRWRPLQSGEVPVVTELIADALDIIYGQWPDLDSRVRSGALRDRTVIRVVAAMVRRAMLNRDADGITQQSQTVGPFGQAMTFANPNGNLYLSADDIRALDPVGPTARVGWLV